MGHVSLDYHRQEHERKKGFGNTPEDRVKLSKLLEQQWREILRVLHRYGISFDTALRVESKRRLSHLVFPWGRMQITLVNRFDRLYAFAHRKLQTEADEKNLERLQIIPLTSKDDRAHSFKILASLRADLRYREFVFYHDRSRLIAEVIQYATRVSRIIDGLA